MAKGGRQGQADKAQADQQRHPGEQGANAEALGDAPGDKQLREQGEGLHAEVDQAEHADLRVALGEGLGHQAGLLEVEKGAGGGQEDDEGADSPAGRARRARG